MLNQCVDDAGEFVGVLNSVIRLPTGSVFPIVDIAIQCRDSQHAGIFTRFDITAMITHVEGSGWIAVNAGILGKRTP